MRTKSNSDILLKALLGATVFILVACVLGLINQLSHEAVATDGNATGPSDAAKAGSDAAKAAGESGSTAKAASGSAELAKMDAGEGSVDFAGSPDNSPNSKDLQVKSAQDNKDDHQFRHNAEDIASELRSLTPQEITKYPITDLSNKDIKLVLQFLDPVDLTKVLLYIPQEDLIKIKHRLNPITFDESLNRLSDEDRTQVEERLISTS
jgi:hypothetical protein